MVKQHKQLSVASLTSPKTKAVAYIRVSSKEQEEVGFSLDAQLKFLNDYARAHDMEVLHTYMDVESAKVAGRTEFGQLVQFLQSQQALPPGSSTCQTVLVEKTDRFYRNVHDLVIIRDLGVTVHLAKENVVMSPGSRSHEKFVHGLNVLLAERMVDNLSEETKKGMLEKAQQGIWPSQAPIGFKNVEGPNRKRIVVQDEVLSPLVKKMFEMYATGLYSTKDLAKEATRIGLVHRKSGNKLGKAAMYDILNNPIYYGDFIWKGVLYNGTHEPIISKELFDKVQLMFKRRSSCPTGRQKHDFLFHGLMTCGHCGCAMVAEIKKGKYIYYHCTGNKGKCPEKYSREEVIDQQFMDSLERIQLDNDVVDWIVEVIHASTADARKQREVQMAAFTQQKQRLEARLDKMYLDKLDGVLEKDEYRRLSSKFRSEVTDVKFSLHQLQASGDVKTVDGNRILELAQKAATLYSAQNQEEKRKLLNCVCSNSTWAGGELTVNFRKPFDSIAITNDEYKQKKVTNPKKSDLIEIWRPLPTLHSHVTF
ncbi:MAG TPA: recombinase family protein [Desulfuromonadales bacterium]|nr:recombinase family protein [Desulfuromonadales bacterium]